MMNLVELCLFEMNAKTKPHSLNCPKYGIHHVNVAGNLFLMWPANYPDLDLLHIENIWPVCKKVGEPKQTNLGNQFQLACCTTQ